MTNTINNVKCNLNYIKIEFKNIEKFNSKKYGGDKMKIRKLAALTAALTVATMSFAGCSKPSESDTVKIGASFDVTGSYAQYGIAASNGAQLAIEEYNAKGGVLGKQIEWLLEDNKGSQVDATNAFKKLVDKDKIVAFIGSDVSSTTETIANIAQERNIPMITPTGTAASITQVGDRIFRACYIDPSQGEMLGQLASGELGAKTAVVMINNESDYSNGIAEAFTEVFTANGGTVVETVKYSATDADYKPILTNVKNANPDVVLIPDYYETIANIATQAREVGVDATFLGGDGWDGVTEKTVNNPEVVEGSYFINHYSPEDTSPVVQDFLKNYEAKYGEKPNAFAALGYDAAKIMIEAIAKAESTDAQAVVDALNATQVEGVTGNVTFDANRNPVKTVAVITIKDGQNKFYQKLDPAQ